MLHLDLRDARQRQGISQRELAERAGVPRSQLQILEAGGNVTLETLRKIVEALGLRLEVVARHSRSSRAG